jgi:UDP-GlcNAc:undecaprenyl-phosphate/decaprenyl-phosphate GlcNAc-1-phosphate transferase
MYLILSFLIATLSCFLTILWLQHSKLAKTVIDRPNHRSLHTDPTPKVGGIGIATGFIASVVVVSLFVKLSLNILLPTLLAYTVLACVSAVDDAVKLSIRVRLTLHFLVALIWLTWCFALPQPSIPKWPLLLHIVSISVVIAFGMVWATNLFNFMDGADGLAGSMALLGFASYGIASSVVGDKTLLFLCVCTCGALVSFLYFNWPAAKVFLGDSGSIPLGFLAAAIGTVGVFLEHWPVDFPLMLFAMFWVDATFTLAQRFIKGRRLGEAHRDHWYQKAIQGGNSHRKVLIIHLMCNIVICGLALYSLKPDVTATLAPRTFIIGMVMAITLGFGVWAQKEYKNFRSIQIE